MDDGTSGPLKVAVTGAGGFVGRALVKVLEADPRAEVRALGRAQLGDLSADTDWGPALEGIDVVVHLAARVHVRDRAEEQFQRINVEASASLARAAARLGVGRMVFLSSAAVMGDRDLGRPFNERDRPQPVSVYAQSKLMAEGVLRDIADSEGVELVILRPPTVYGIGAAGDWRTLLRLCRLPIPLPFGCADNRRSMVSVVNLCDVIRLATRHPDVASRTFFVSDEEVLSVAETIRTIRRALGKPEWLVPVPLRLLRLCISRCPGGAAPARILSNFEIDASTLHEMIGWRSVERAETGLTRMAQWFDGAPRE